MGFIASPIIKNYRELTVASPADAAAKRTALIRAIFHQDALPAHILVAGAYSSGVASLTLTTKGPLAGSNTDFVFTLTHAQPTIGNNGKIFLYCLGHEDVPLTDVANWSPMLRDLGYDFCRIPMAGITPNTGPVADNSVANSLNNHSNLVQTLGIDAIQVFMLPILAAVNYFSANGFAGKIALAGFSGGAGLAALYAALDPRVKRSFLFNGTAPTHLKTRYDDPVSGTAADPSYRSDGEQNFSGLGISHMDMYAMAAFNHQRQFYNDNDRGGYPSSKIMAMDYQTPISNLVTPYGGVFTVTNHVGLNVHYTMYDVAAVTNAVIADLGSM